MKDRWSKERLIQERAVALLEGHRVIGFWRKDWRLVGLAHWDLSQDEIVWFGCSERVVTHRGPGRPVSLQEAAKRMNRWSHVKVEYRLVYLRKDEGGAG